MKDFKNIYHKFQTDKSEPENELKTTDKNRGLRIRRSEEKILSPLSRSIFLETDIGCIWKIG